MLELKIFEGLDKITDADVRNTWEGVEPNEVEVGVVPADLRKLSTLATKLAGEALATIAEFRKGVPSNGDQIMIQAKAEKIELLKSIFWAELRLRLNLNGADLGIRRGWKVVKTPPEIPTLLDAIKMIEELANAEDNDCGNPNCPVHGHLHRPEAETAGRGGGPRIFALGRQRRRGES